MSYRKILLAYMHHVAAQEGSDYLGWDNFHGFYELSPEENRALIKARDETRKQRGD